MEEKHDVPKQKSFLLFTSQYEWIIVWCVVPGAAAAHLTDSRGYARLTLIKTNSKTTSTHTEHKMMENLESCAATQSTSGDVHHQIAESSCSCFLETHASLQHLPISISFHQKGMKIQLKQIWMNTVFIVSLKRIVREGNQTLPQVRSYKLTLYRGSSRSVQSHPHPFMYAECHCE